MSDHASLSPRTAPPLGDYDLKSGAIDCEIEHRNIAYLFLQLKSDRDGPFGADRSSLKAKPGPVVTRSPAKRAQKPQDLDRSEILSDHRTSGTRLRGGYSNPFRALLDGDPKLHWRGRT
jgi:hypothetical protein